MTAAPWRARPGEHGYPSALAALSERAPRVIWGVGSRDLVAALEPCAAVTIVGSRRSGGYGRSAARRLGCELASAGLTVVSGMAIGCDAAAHEGALDAGGATIAVLGGGPDVVYPRSHAGLYRRIVAGGGAVISERAPGTEVHPGCFPERNRIMAAIAGMTVIVEGADPSGTRITADEAVSCQRDVGAVPGPVGSRLSELPHNLIRDGAALVRDAQDVLDVLLGVGAVRLRHVGPPLEPVLDRALAAVEQGASTCDAIAMASGLDPGDADVAVARLQLFGYARVDTLGRVSRTGLAAPERTPAA